MRRARVVGSVNRLVRRGCATHSRAAQLAGIALFRGLTEEQIRPLAAASDVVTFQPGDRIVNQGDPGESLYVILDGRVEVLARIVEGGAVAETVIAWMSSGDALGELSLLDGEPRSASCAAITPVSALRLQREPFLAAVERNWSLGHALYGVLAKRLRVADTLLAEHSRDPLTGLSNRRALADLYEREAQRIQRAIRQDGTASLEPLAVVFVDVNRFKQINDTHGHQGGDDVLKSVATLLTTVSRATDLVARYGGDEFVLLLPEAGRHGAEGVIERIRESLAGTPPGPIPFTLSLGYALVQPDRPDGLDAVLAQADVAMYRDKSDHHRAAEAA